MANTLLHRPADKDGTNFLALTTTAHAALVLAAAPANHNVGESEVTEDDISLMQDIMGRAGEGELGSLPLTFDIFIYRLRKKLHLVRRGLVYSRGALPRVLNLTTTTSSSGIPRTPPPSATNTAWGMFAAHSSESEPTAAPVTRESLNKNRKFRVVANDAKGAVWEVEFGRCSDEETVHMRDLGVYSSTYTAGEPSLLDHNQINVVRNGLRSGVASVSFLVSGFINLSWPAGFGLGALERDVRGVGYQNSCCQIAAYHNDRMDAPQVGKCDRKAGVGPGLVSIFQRKAACCVKDHQENQNEDFGLKNPIFGQGFGQISTSKTQFFGQPLGGASRGLLDDGDDSDASADDDFDPTKIPRDLHVFSSRTSDEDKDDSSPVISSLAL
ncbi:hypothetical protein C8J57DRAFT_1664066 [Mycena rebaudengoi]|nr:hypothetical protein C8J57DRAFT_1664066 [Mycena rebaudengoi]